jgi:hypothetical protein
MCGVSNCAVIDAALHSGIAARKIPNAVGMVANRKQTLYKGAFGVRDDSGAPISIDSIFAIFSMTKAVTTVAALQLVEAGKLTLDGPVSKYLPKLASPKILKGFDENGKPKLQPAETQSTLRQLLTHTSGLVYDVGDADMMRFTADHPGPEAEATLLFEPGTRWLYGTGLDGLWRPLAECRWKIISEPSSEATRDGGYQFYSAGLKIRPVIKQVASSREWDVTAGGPDAASAAS